MLDRTDVVAAHPQLREASDAAQHLLVVEELTQQQIDDARDRLARAYQQVKDADEAALRV
jgi:hypothetical protein